MSEMRTYGDPCGIARALDLVGERWSLLVVRELVLGPKRFTDLRAGLGGASANVLSQRLRELEDAGVVRKRKTGAATYELTEWGEELHPILLMLGRWGARSRLRPGRALGVDALMLALESTFDAAAAGDLSAAIELRLGDERFTVRIANAAIAIARGACKNWDAVIETNAAALRATIFGARKLETANVTIRGDKRRAKTFFRLFVRPLPALAS